MSSARHRWKGDRIEPELVEDARLFRDWLAWHRDERKAVLAGPHGAMFERLLYILKTLTLKSAALLPAHVRGIDWSAIDSPTQLIVLHEINNGITDLRIRHGLAPFDDGIERNNVFCIIRQLLFSAQCGATRGAARFNQRNTLKSRN